MGAFILWPASLPSWVRSGSSYESGENTVRSQVDQGPAKVRKRFTQGVSQSRLVFELTHAQADTLRAFYENASYDIPQGTGGGSLPFVFTDPVNDTSSDWRFVEPPRLVLDEAGGHWNVVVVVERMP